MDWISWLQWERGWEGNIKFNHVITTFFFFDGMFEKDTIGRVCFILKGRNVYEETAFSILRHD